MVPPVVGFHVVIRRNRIVVNVANANTVILWNRAVHFRDAFYAANSRELADDYAGATEMIYCIHVECAQPSITA